MVPLPSSLPVRLARALRLRCPLCGGGPLFRRWLGMRPACPRCHLRLDRGEPDYFFGGYVLNFVAAELTLAAAAVLAIVGSWPDVPWRAIEWGLVALAVPAPLLTYPFTKTLWLAIDIGFRAPVWADFEGHGENG